MTALKTKYVQFLAIGISMFAMQAFAEVPDAKLNSLIGKEVLIEYSSSAATGVKRTGNTISFDKFSYFSGSKNGFLKTVKNDSIIMVFPDGNEEISKEDIRSIELSKEKSGSTLEEMDLKNARALELENARALEKEKEMELENARALEKEKLNEPLLLAYKEDDLEMMKIALSKGADVNYTDSEGYPIIAGAAISGKTAMVAALLDAGADVNAKVGGEGIGASFNKHEGWTALHFATVHGHSEIVELLLNKGASPNAITADSFFGNAPKASPLILAAFKEHVEIVKILIAAGANVNYEIKKTRKFELNGLTPLKAAKNQEIKKYSEKQGQQTKSLISAAPLRRC